MSMPIGEVPSRSEDATAVEVGRPSSWPGFASKPAIDAREYTSTRGLEVSLTKTSTSPAFQAGAAPPPGDAEVVATTTSAVRPGGWWAGRSRGAHTQRGGVGEGGPRR